ncbi:MAG: 2,3-bisphosphoglycerate-independent phosphoglycerate mutase [Acidobacteriota bacterium]|nr:2,3-bisphosphoglycerate-independent phosphoglycerate mutase [Blastocatellia bacterium]MDW8413087.1 2,3-bisphosphoglycerate-independent phosphoglycerate mutase [Acidobacteriota bacterium]
MKTFPVALIILDGWGYETRREGNAILAAHKPFWDSMWERFAHTLVIPYGKRVGLPVGQMGNSEVGHLNIGAGRIVRMDISRIDCAIESGDLFTNPALCAAMQHVQQTGGALHFFGLVSDGGVHSHQEHLYALIRMAKEKSLDRVYVHAFTDGRDTSPEAGAGYVAQLLDKMKQIGVGKLASVCGRYYAMDRDKRWERTQLAYDMLVRGQGKQTTDPVAALQESYAEGVTDEFIKPIVVLGDDGFPVATVRDGDSVIFFNFRADRARQLTRALTEENFAGFDRGQKPNIHFVCMTQYDADFNLPVAFEPVQIKNILADVFAERGLRNLRIAETEKYAHVTFFFNGGVEEPFPLERRILIPSPKVATYDLKPEMSAFEVTDTIVREIERGETEVFIINYANADMVGHTGVMDAAVKAIEVLDKCLERVITALLRVGGKAIITADHGNSEKMIDYETGEPYTAHTIDNPVPLIVVDPDFYGRLREGGALEDVAPTLLGLLGIKPPSEMTGRDLRSLTTEI